MLDKLREGAHIVRAHTSTHTNMDVWGQLFGLVLPLVPPYCPQPLHLCFFCKLFLRLVLYSRPRPPVSARRPFPRGHRVRPSQSSC